MRSERAGCCEIAHQIEGERGHAATPCGSSSNDSRLSMRSRALSESLR
jgi:hypothetical protein